MEQEMDILVLGVGNILLMDEGIGIKAVETLENRFDLPDNVEILDGGTAGIELLRHIQGRKHLIIIDAMKCDHPPGTVMRIQGDDVPAAFRTRISPHQLGLSDLLAAALLTDGMPENVVLFGVEPKTMETGFSLSREVEASYDKLIDAVIDELKQIGCDVQPRTEYSSEESFWSDCHVS
jgi:hydrogenase maturation protease